MAPNTDGDVADRRCGVLHRYKSGARLVTLIDWATGPIAGAEPMAMLG
jgi:hypothetical protein